MGELISFERKHQTFCLVGSCRFVRPRADLVGSIAYASNILNYTRHELASAHQVFSYLPSGAAGREEIATYLEQTERVAATLCDVKSYLIWLYRRQASDEPNRLE